MKYYLYNPKSNSGIKPAFLDGLEYASVLDIDYKKFFEGLAPDDEVVVIGGDGTLNRFINAIDPDNLKNKVWFRAAGSGNDFNTDIENTAKEEILINDYIKNLPAVCVNGMEQKFINGIGYGIDGYCCEVADRIHETEPHKVINYAGIAIKGLLFHFKPRAAIIKVDGKEYNFKHVWLAPSMKGRYYGGGMKVTPEQDRKGDTLSVMVYHTCSKLKALIAFPNIFKGTHVENKKMVTVMTGKEIEVSFAKPCALQIDGETVLSVSGYKVKA